MRAFLNVHPRLQLLMIVGISAVSLAGAWLLFQGARDGGLWATTNHGRFVQPPVTVEELGIASATDEPLEAGKWWLWVVPQGPCDQTCRNALYQLRQLHVLLNRDAARVRRALLGAQPADAAELTETYPRLQMLSGNLSSLDRGIYIVDPLGNLVFYYTFDQGADDILDDLERLLKVSQIG
ncbi:MAG: hypothetical protein U5Q16_02695 [Gammaproteobacteria bacterium]|nr:hypothetical protein [Gammaproteobacteria bacterium]